MAVAGPKPPGVCATRSYCGQALIMTANPLFMVFSLIAALCKMSFMKLKYGQPIAPNLNVRHLCPNCRSDPPNIIEEYSKGDLVCGDCGTILGDRIVDTRSECE